MFITYNGVNLSLTSIDRLQRDTVFSDDGTTVLYVENTLSVSCVYAPVTGSAPYVSGTSVGGSYRANPGLQPTQTASGTSFVGQNPPPSATSAALIKTSGMNPTSPSCTLPSTGGAGWAGPVATDRELELRLRAPRKKLIVWAMNSTTGAPVSWIESPLNDNPCDAKYGPVVLGCHVKEGPNANSFFVALDIRTWTTPTSPSTTRPVLSHRWQMTHTEDESHHLTRTIKGQIVFNMGVLHKFKVAADWLREEMFHPIPIGFERSLGPITLSPDNTTLNYEYSDTDPKIIFDSGESGATHISIVETAAYITPSRAINTA